MIPVDLLPGARRDYDESFAWYAERSDSAAARFATAIDDAFGRIAAAPDQFAAIDAVHRECLVNRFPFRVVYRIEAHRVLVVAVAHAKRRPNYWANRE
jgi:plasmid stabilization system protein ParE